MSQPLRAAMVRHSTLDPSLWPRALRALAGLGFNAVDVPLVWRELEPGGSTGHLGGLARFLDAAAAEGLRAVVRLGPWPTSDVERLGLPDRVLHDRACQARTRRQNPVYVPDLPGLAPLPSLASSRYREEAGAWVSAAAAAVAPRAKDGAVARVVVGHGPPAVLRDDFFEADHHPDARGDDPPVAPPHRPPLDAAVAEVGRQTAHARDFLLGLRAAALAQGVPEGSLALAVTGGALASPLAVALAATHALSLAAPPPRAGATGIWRQVRFARSFPGGAHLDLRAGSPPFEPPVRATHALQAARLALAAGARDFTVQMGCAGGGWVGALLDERAEPRPHAARWGALLEWAASLPEGRELGADLRVRYDDVVAARAATGVHPLPAGLLAWAGFLPEELAAEGALPDRRDEAVERALGELGLPWRRCHEKSAGDGAWEGGDVAGFVGRAAGELGRFAPRVEPAGSALVRAVERDGRVALVVASAAEGPVRVAPPAEGRWHDGGGLFEGERALPSGEVLVLREVGA